MTTIVKLFCLLLLLAGTRAPRSLKELEEGYIHGKGLTRDDKVALEFMFALSVMSLVFFIMLRFCPPLCRRESEHDRRLYLDTQLQVGELY